MKQEYSEMIEALDLTPDLRAKDGAAGLPVVLADGEAWLLADGGLDNFLDELRDRIDDEARLYGQVQVMDVRRVAFALLKANYDLTDAEAAGLLLEANDQALTEAVSLALFGTTDDHQTYTKWATSALLANGLDPEKIPGRHRANVLHHLVETGRAIPIGKFTDAAIAAPKIKEQRARAMTYEAARKQREAEAEAARLAAGEGAAHEDA